MKNTGEIAAFKSAFRGIKNACFQERHLRFHFLAAGLVILAALFFRVRVMEWLIILLVIGQVIALELLNSAVEAITDRICPQIDPFAKYVKDVAAGAVLVMSIAAAITGLIIFIPKIILLAQGL